MSVGRVVGAGLGILGGIAVLTILFGSWYTVDQGERGVILTNGAITEESVEPGLHFKTPIIDDLVRIDVRDHSLKWEGDAAMQAYSRDQQPAELTVSVNYAVVPSETGRLYSEYGSVEAFLDRSLIRKAPQAVKQVFGQYNAQQAVIERAKLSQQSLDALTALMAGEPVIISSLQVENIDYSSAYEDAVEQRMLAEVEVAKRNQQLETEKINAQIAVTQAQGRADSVKAEADAAAYSVEVRGKAEAGAIQARGSALRDNPSLIDLTAVEKWDGTLPTTIPPNGTVPFLNLVK